MGKFSEISLIWSARMQTCPRGICLLESDRWSLWGRPALRAEAHYYHFPWWSVVKLQEQSFYPTLLDELDTFCPRGGQFSHIPISLMKNRFPIFPIWFIIQCIGIEWKYLYIVSNMWIQPIISILSIKTMIFIFLLLWNHFYGWDYFYMEKGSQFKKFKIQT